MKTCSQHNLKNRVRGKGKRGFSSIVGAVFMVLIMMVLASSYFVYTLSQNTAYNAAVGQKNQLDQSVRSENLQCLNTTYTAFNDTNVNIDFGIRNIGSTSVQFITIWISVSSLYSDWVGYNFKNLSRTVQPSSVYADRINMTVAGLNSSYVYSYASWLVTSKGNTVALVTRVMAGNIIIAQTTQGIGALMMDFQNFTYYNVSGNQLSGFPAGAPGYLVTSAGNNLAFRVMLTNLDMQQRDITLFSNSVFFSIFPTTPQQVRGSYWYIVNINSAGVISSNYTTVTMPFNVPTAIYFASDHAIVPGQPFVGAKSNFVGTSPVNLALIGKLGSDSFGQNIPFVSILIQS